MSGSAHHYLVVAMTQNARRLDAFGLDPASMPWTTQGSFYGPPPLLANLAMAHPCLLAARFLLSARPPDLLQFVCSMSQGRPPPRNRTRDDMDPPNPGSQPIRVSDPQPSLAPLSMWPVVFDHIMQLLGRSYRFVLTRSTAIATRSLSRHYVRFTCRGQ